MNVLRQEIQGAQIHQNNSFVEISSGLDTFIIKRSYYSASNTAIYFWVIILSIASITELVFFFTENHISASISVLAGSIILLSFEKSQKMIAQIYEVTLITISFIIFFILIDSGIILINLRIISLAYSLILIGLSVYRKWDWTLIILFILIGLQLYVASAWYDGSSDTNGIKVMIGFLLITGVLGAISLSLLGALTIFLSIQPNYYTKWNFVGMFYIAGICLCLSLISFLPLGIQWLNYPPAMVLGSSMVINLTMIVYSFFLKTEIIIFLCDSNQSIIDKKTTTFREIPKQSLENLAFYLVSQNYCSQSYSTEYSTNKKIGHCLICYEGIASVLSMPCGHLSLCLQCKNKLFEYKDKGCCILCKNSINTIYILNEVRQKNTSLFQKQQISDKAIDDKSHALKLKISKGFTIHPQ